MLAPRRSAGLRPGVGNAEDRTAAEPGAPPRGQRCVAERLTNLVSCGCRGRRDSLFFGKLIADWSFLTSTATFLSGGLTDRVSFQFPLQLRLLFTNQFGLFPDVD